MYRAFGEPLAIESVPDPTPPSKGVVIRVAELKHEEDMTPKRPFLTRCLLHPMDAYEEENQKSASLNDEICPSSKG